MHFFRRSKIHLDCFTKRRDVMEYASIVNGAEATPTWWRKLPKSIVNPLNGFSEAPTMRTCTGMHEYYRHSVAMPLWSELCINVPSKQTYSWQFSDECTKAEVHNKEQYIGFDTGGFQHLKIVAPWWFRCKEDIGWLQTMPIYNNALQSNFFLAQGQLNFSRQGAVNLQLFINTNDIKTFTIPFGTMFLMTPLSDKKVVIHRHLVSAEMYDSFQEISSAITFINKYRQQQRTTYCPYKDHIK